MRQVPRSEHPRPDRKRAEWLCLNGEWDFEIDNQKVGIEQEYYLRQTLDGKITLFSRKRAVGGGAYGFYAGGMVSQKYGDS